MKTLVSAIAIIGFVLVGMAYAQKFENKDTAEDRHDYTWGTRETEGYFGTDQYGGDSWGTEPGEPEPERNWYDEIIITVSPDVGYGSKTVLSEEMNATGEVTNSTRTTTTY